MVLPAGSTLPPLPYLLGILGGAFAVGSAIIRRQLPLRTHTVAAFAPWMVAGGALYVLYQKGVTSGPLAPLFSSPTVYVTTGILGGSAWLVASRGSATAKWLAVSGGIAALMPTGVAVAVAVEANTLSPGWSLLGAGVAGALSLGLWWVYGQYRPNATEVLGAAGGLAIFAHVLDAVSTGIGVNVLQFGEQTPLSAVLLDIGAFFPPVPLIGTAWLFLIVKAAVAVGLVWLLEDLIEEDPPLGNGLLLLVTAVGLGPAAHNLLLFAVSGPAGV